MINNKEDFFCSHNRLGYKVKEDKHYFFSCCGRCSFDDEEDGCKPDYFYFEEHAEFQLKMMTQQEKENLYVSYKGIIAFFTVPEPDWKAEMKKCVNSPYYFYTHYFQIKTKEGFKLATTKLNEEQFNEVFESLSSRRFITKKRVR